MRLLPPLLSFALLSLLLPHSVRATNVRQELTPEQIQEQEWDTQCRDLLPFGQGDLEAALLTKLRECINEKRNAQAIAESIAKERQRLSDRRERESSRRAMTLTRIRGSELRVQGALHLRAAQGTALQILRTRSNYQRVHQRLRDLTVPSATSD